MAKQVIISTPQNDPSGTPLDSAFTMCNSNFTELYTAEAELRLRTESSENTVMIGQGAGNESLASDTTTSNFLQIPMSDGIPTAGPGVKGPGAMYFETGVTSGITEGLYISDSSGVLKLVQIA